MYHHPPPPLAVLLLRGVDGVPSVVAEGERGSPGGRSTHLAPTHICVREFGPVSRNLASSPVEDPQRHRVCRNGGILPRAILFGCQWGGYRGKEIPRATINRLPYDEYLFIYNSFCNIHSHCNPSICAHHGPDTYMSRLSTCQLKISLSFIPILQNAISLCPLRKCIL